MLIEYLYANVPTVIVPLIDYPELSDAPMEPNDFIVLVVRTPLAETRARFDLAGWLGRLEVRVVEFRQHRKSAAGSWQHRQICLITLLEQAQIRMHSRRCVFSRKSIHLVGLPRVDRYFSLMICKRANSQTFHHNSRPESIAC